MDSIRTCFTTCESSVASVTAAQRDFGSYLVSNLPPSLRMFFYHIHIPTQKVYDKATYVILNLFSPSLFATKIGKTTGTRNQANKSRGRSLTWFT